MIKSEHTLPESVRRTLVELTKGPGGIPVTLNGQRAIVSGIQRDFAKVRQVESGLAAEWSWPAVQLILSRGGDFRS